MSSQSYERMVEKREGVDLAYYTETANNKKDDQEDDKLFANLSIKQILTGISETFIDILNDIVTGKIDNASRLVNIFIKDNRLIYLSIILVMIAFSMYLVDITS